MSRVVIGISIGVQNMIREFGFLSFNSIRAKFLALVVPLVLLSTITVFGLFELDARRDANLELQDKLDKLVTIQSAVVAESLWNVADEQIKLSLAALAIDPDVESAAVYDELDQLVGFTGSADEIETRPFFASKEIVFRRVGCRTVAMASRAGGTAPAAPRRALDPDQRAQDR